MAQPTAPKGGNYKDIPLSPTTEGVILDTTLAHYVAPEGSVSWAENLHNDTLGVMTARYPLGTAQTTGNAVNLPASYIFQAWSGQLSSYTIAVNEAGTVKTTTDFLSTAITTVAGTANSYTNFDYIQGYLGYLTNTGQLALYQSGGAVAATKNLSFATGCNILSMGFAGRVWATTYGDTTTRVYYSDVIPSTGITNVTGTGQFLSLNVNESDTPTGLWRSQNCLFVFTQSSIFRIYSTQSVDNSPCANVGAISQKAITNGKDGVYFASQNGIFRLSQDGDAVDVSQRIRSVLQNIYPENVTATQNTRASVNAWSDADSVYFSYGYNSGITPKMPVTAGEDLDKSYILKYHVPTQNWSVYSVAGAIVVAAAQGNLVSTGAAPLGSYERQFPTVPLIIADAALNKYYISKYNNYSLLNTASITNYNDFNRATSPMYVKYVTNWQTFGSEAHFKRITGLSIASANAGGLKFGYIVDGDDLTKVRPIGTVGGEYVTLFRDFQTTAFNRIKFVVTGTAQGPLTIGQITVLGLDDLGYEAN